MTRPGRTSLAHGLQVIGRCTRSEQLDSPLTLTCGVGPFNGVWSSTPEATPVGIGLKGPKTRSGAVSVDVCSRDGGFRVKGMACPA
jgi:hypothetical protein